MKRISVKVLSLSNLATDKAVYCELDLNGQIQKTKVFKNDSTLDQQFNLGQFHVCDRLHLSCKEKRSGDLLATNILSLDQFAAEGNYDHEITLGEIGTVTVQITVSTASKIKRSSSIQNFKGKLFGFLSKEKEKKEEPESEGLSHITHSHSHMGDLSSAGEQKEGLKRTLSEELLVETGLPKRRQRRKTRVKTENESTNEKSKSKKSRKDKLGEEENSPASPRRERRRKKTKTDASDPTSDDIPKKGRKRTNTKESGSGGSKSAGSKGKKEKKEKSEESEKVEEPQNSEKKEEPSQPTKEVEEPKPTVSGGPKRRTVVLQPIGKSMKLFGTPLEDVMAQQKETHPHLTVPSFVVTADRIIREKGFTVQGIFRIRGKLKEVKELKQKFDDGEPIDEENCNVHLISTLLKAFLRELPVPILTFENYEAFMGAADFKGEEQIGKLADIMSSLPKPNYELTKFIFKLFHDLSLHSAETQMTADNLAKVLSPNLIWKKELDIMDLSAVQDAMKGNILAQVMIEHHEKMFRE